VASGTTVSAGGTELVNSGGTTVNATLLSGGSVLVSLGGEELASGVTVSGGTVLSGGTAAVQAGGVISGGTLLSGSTELVLSGGLVSGTTVSAGVSLVVSSGGTGINTNVLTGATGTISSGGTEIASAGTATSVTISSGGTELVLSNGLAASSTVSSGGTEILSSGGTSVLNTVGNGGTLIVSSAGFSEYNSVTSGGLELVVSGGISYVDTIGSGATLIVSSGGTGDYNNVNSGGVEIVSSGGTISDETTVSGGTIILNGTAGSGTVTLAGSGAELIVSGTTMPTNVIGGFTSGDMIDLASVNFSTGDTAVLSGSVLIVTEALTGSAYVLNLSGNYTSQYFHLTSGAVGTVITVDGTPCYCRGTLILTDRGEVPVETLAIGDRLVTKSGEAKPIRWIGRRGYNGRFARKNPKVLPVLIRKGALGEGLPKRNLYVSPEHAMFIDGVLVPAIALVNGITIEQPADPMELVEYFHLELEAHDVIFAEGAMSESFVDDDSRGMFINAHEYRTLYPDAPYTEALYCAPRVEGGEELHVIRQKLNRIARNSKRYTRQQRMPSAS
jgi:autotransporter passenger strand-loop-strand repeat protein